MRKICSYKDGAPVQFTIKDPTDTTAFMELGFTNGRRYASYESTNVTFGTHPEEVEFKIFDLKKAEDAALLDSVAFDFEITQRFRADQRQSVIGDGLYSIIDQILNNPDALRAEVAAIEAAVTAKLVELGLKK